MAMLDLWPDPFTHPNRIRFICLRHFSCGGPAQRALFLNLRLLVFFANVSRISGPHSRVACLV